MDKNLPIRQPSLSDQVYEIILKGISDGTYPTGTLLPSENQLAERFNVSRPTIRAAFARLVERGSVKRRRGVGTYVAEQPSIVNPLYQFLDVHERISARGFEPGFKQVMAEIIAADDMLSKSLDIPVGSNILNTQKLFFADGDPIILFINYIPEWVYTDCLTDEDVLAPGATEPFFEFFADRCNNRVKYLTSVIKPKIFQECNFPDAFEFEDPNAAILVIEDIGYDEGDTPLFLSVEHLVGEASTLHVIRHVENL
jgi:GntR family transcriptional regulator